MSQFAWDSLSLCLFFQYLLMAYSHSQECPNRIIDSVVWLTQPPVTPIESCLSLIFLLHVGMHGDLPLANRIWQWWQHSHSLDYLRLQRERFSCGPWRMSCLLPMVRATGTVARNTGQPLGIEGLHLPDARNWILLASENSKKETADFLIAAFETLSRGLSWAVSALLTHGHRAVLNECWFRPLSLCSFVFSNQNWYMWLPQL